MNRIKLAAAFMATIMGCQAHAQTFVSMPAPAAARTQTLYLPVGTPLTLVTRTQVSPSDGKVGDRVYLTVVQSVTYHHQLIIPAGATAVAAIARADRGGHSGRPDKFDVKLLYVETPGGPVRLTGMADDPQVAGDPVARTVAFVGPAAVVIRGTSAPVAYGATVQACLAEDLHFVVSDPTPQVGMVQPDRPGPIPVNFTPRSSGLEGVRVAQR